MSESACGSCGTANRAGAKFCIECGMALAATCPACGAVAEGGKFCAECGAPLAAHTPAATAATATPAAAPVAERRLVSSLFADLVGFTPLSESRDAEAVRELLSAYFDAARAVVERYGGVVEKFIGDAVFAVWGVPIAREDDAERAVRAGLDLVSAVQALGEELGIDGLRMRVGITTGQVAVSLGVVGEGMVAGDAVNTAARVQSVAAPGEVWVDDTTRSLTTVSVAYVSTGSHELKGKSQPVELFHATRTTSVLGGEQRVDGLEAPFVGRDRELRLVKEMFHATAEDVRPRLVLVCGEPGIGKSRLAWEFEKYADAITSQSTYWLRGRCLSYGQGVAGRVVGEMVRSHLRVTDGDGDDVVAAALDGRLEEHISDIDERAMLRARLASLLGLSDRTFEQADLFASWRTFLERLTGDGSSVTLVVEDLQWADDGFLEFVEHVLEAARAPIMVLALARPDLIDRRPGLAAGRRSSTVFLEPLSDMAMGRLLDGLVADLPASLHAELIRRAEGVPLYAVETVRALIDRDVIIPVAGRYVVDDSAARSLDLAALGPPASLQALLAARLDSLDDEERRVVQDGSVLGLAFTRAGIGALAPAGIDVDRALESLRRKEILTIDIDPRSPERGQFRFVQALLRTVAYDTLSRRDRHARHLAVAEYLAGTPDAEAMSGLVASHILDALASLPDSPDVPALRGRAATLLEQAAVHAIGVGAPSDALLHYSRLIELAADDASVVRAAVAGADLAAGVRDRFDDVLAWIDVALAAAERSSGLERERLMLKLRQAHLRLLGGSTNDAADAQAVFDAALDRPEWVSLLAEATRVINAYAQSLGDPAMAFDYSLRAIDPIERFGSDDDFETLLHGLSMWAGISGYRRLSALLRRAQVTRYDERDPRGVTPLANVSSAAVADDLDEARTAAREATRRADALGVTGARISAAGNLMLTEVLAGNWDEALAVARHHRRDGVTERVDWELYLNASASLIAWGRHDREQFLEPVVVPADFADPVAEGWHLMEVAVQSALGGDLTAGADASVRAVRRMGDLGLAHEDMPAAFLLAVDLLLADGDRVRLAELTELLETVSTGQRSRALHGQLLRARAHLGDDPVSDPAPLLRGAIDTFESMSAGYCAARVRIELAAALAAAGDSRAAAEALDAAEPVLLAAGATGPLDEITRLRASLVGVPTT